MDEETKSKIKEVMEKHLRSLGWPDCPNPDELIMENLRPMFNLLIKEDLVKYTDYDGYWLAAQIQYAKSR